MTMRARAMLEDPERAPLTIKLTATVAEWVALRGDILRLRESSTISPGADDLLRLINEGVALARQAFYPKERDDG
jgi:hypothetical protein